MEIQTRSNASEPTYLYLSELILIFNLSLQAVMHESLFFLLDSCMNLSLWMLSSQPLSVVPAGQVATVDQLDAQMFMVLARSFEQRLGNFIAQNLANTAWAFATVDQSDAQLFAALARAAEQRLGDFD